MRIPTVVMALVLVAAPAAGADGGDVESGGSEWTAVADNTQQSTSSTDPTSSSDDGGHLVQVSVCELGGDMTCDEPARCEDGSLMYQTSYVLPDGTILWTSLSCPTDSTPPVEITNAMIARAFKRIPLPASRLVVQPPGGETLVNFDTNFYTEAEPFERSVTLVGQRIDLRIWPSSFGWSFGDGTETRTEEPGAAYPDLDVTHAYLEAGRVGASVDTTYSAEFRVNGGAWRPVVGTVTMAGEPVGLRVRTATPTLVGYR